MAPLIRWNSTPKCTTLPCPQRSNPLRQRSLLPPLQMRHTTVNLMMMVTSRGTERAGYPEQSRGSRNLPTQSVDDSATTREVIVCQTQTLFCSNPLL